MSQAETDKEQTKMWDNGGNLDILLPTIGSAGDVHPVIELGSALKERGHHATVVTNQFFEQQVRDAGLDKEKGRDRRRVGRLVLPCRGARRKHS